VKRVLVSCLALSASLLCAASPALAASARLTPTGDAKFPKRSYVLTLPAGAAVGGATVHVAEDGQPVTRLRVRSASDRFAVLLLIDASTSMRGAPIRGAMAAARAFAQQRPSGQALGVVTFNDVPTVVVPLTKDSSTIERGLAPRPVLRQGTHIYDALQAALRAVAGKRYDAAAVVLLSDGHDYGSTATSKQVVAAARRAHAKLFTVGLRSSYYDPSTLVDIAQRGSGEYLGAATPGKLTALYQRLGSQLSAAYSLQYLSAAGAGSHVAVSASLGSERARIGYTAPRLQVSGVDSSRHADGGHGFLGTGTGAAVVAIIVFALAFLALGAYFQQRRRGAIRERLSYYGATTPAPALAFDDESLRKARREERSGWLLSIESDLELGRLAMSPLRYLLECTAMAAFVAIFAAAVIGGGAVALLAFAIGWPGIVWARRRRAIAKQRRLFADQLADNIETVASALRTGHSFVGALSQMIETAPEPSATEFQRVIADERLGVPIESALGAIVERMRNKHLKQVSLVTVIQRDTGGNGSEALDRVVENIRAGDDLRRLVKTLTSQGRIAQVVLTALPVVTAIAFRTVGGPNMDPLFESGAGHIALIVAAMLVTLGGLWIGRIVKVKV
jgi:tight adherence protein B